MTNRLLDSSMPISSPAPHRSRFACLPRTCDRAATQLPASFNPMQQPPLVLALGWTLHARRKSLKARARPSCRALDEQRVARRPTVPSVQHCPGADRARRYPPPLLLILLVKGGLSVLWPEICRSIWRCAGALAAARIVPLRDRGHREHQARPVHCLGPEHRVSCSPHPY